MSFSRIATLAHLRSHLINNDRDIPRGLAELAGRLAVDPSMRTAVLNIAAGRPLTAALMWITIADQTSGQARVEALSLAAFFAMRGGNPGIAATMINRADVAARRDNVEFPPVLDILKLDHRIREHLTPAAV
ncbi:hypothetical protein MAHJHV58_49070 [Mycobacterium avium subsp. hominissuis]|uniref:hypothetical protein n=1 Tax=Mycobacterium avium TaxID=1764 RepID=UPI000BAF202B|nr:hypothetical protein [Mycobacterium avium]PBA38811.1 hypothetical protein CKJ63_25450 [Mycobacterium avium]PBA78722.1 hypothetical protein CKJ72_25490 [Mycobacterium avium]